MRIKMPAVRIAQADSDTIEPETAQDILTCGSCQKTFALSDIVKFIQHKVLQCNKENYGQCFPQGSAGDRDSDDGRPLSLVNRRPSISAPISRKPSGSRVHTPPPSSPPELLGDGASSTPKNPLNENESTSSKRRASSSSILGSSLDDENHTKNLDKLKPDTNELSSSHEEELSIASGEQRPLKKSRTDVADAESNTINSEPSNYVCSTCKARLNSAWRLVQHVQYAHGVKIYIEPGAHILSYPLLPASSSSEKDLSSSSTCSSSSNVSKNLNLSQPPHIQIPSALPPPPPSSLTLPPGHSPALPPIVLPSPTAVQPPPTSQSQQQPSHNQSLQQQPPSMRHHPMLPPHDMVHQNPFALLRMPLPPPPVAPLFARPHHDFRMEQLVSEQFRHHGLNLAAAAVAAANSLASSVPHNSSFQQTITTPERPLSTGRIPTMPPLPPTTTSTMGMEPQMDFYSQRLRQLAGTTSPSGTVGNSSSPSPRKQQSPPFASPPTSHQLPPTPLTSQSRPQSMTPPDKHSIGINSHSTDIESESRIMPTTPRSSSTPPTTKQSQNCMTAVHACEFCGKKFRFQGNLMVHRRSHTGDKELKCNDCDFICFQASKLKQHLKVHEKPEDRTSNAGSVETLDGDDSQDALDDEEVMDEEEEEEEEEEDDDGDNMEYEAEDLSVSSKTDSGKFYIKRDLSNIHQPSLVGELMDKFGLSNIAQYSEAYKQALQESCGNHNMLKYHLTNKDRVNNNSSAMPPLPDKLNGLPAALRLREEFAKNMLQSQQAHAPNQVPLFNPFENPFESSKRLKMERMESDWWNLSNLHRGEHLFENLKAKSQIIPTSSANLLNNPLVKKESRRNDTCEYCGKVFKNCSNLTVHRRSHTGEKPYKCELCSYACAQSSKLTRHMKTHGRMGKDVYRCRFCDMPFSVPSTLEKHMRKCVVNKGHQSGGGGGGGGGGGNSGLNLLNPPMMSIPPMPLITSSSGDDDSGATMIKEEA